jgi:hypothetical protein
MNNRNLNLRNLIACSGLVAALGLGCVSALGATNITMSLQEPEGDDWDTPGFWSDGNPASVSAAANPGQGYELLAGSRCRNTSPGGTGMVFPGAFLQIDGDGVLGPLDGEFRFKTGEYGTVYFTNLIMNGGQLDESADLIADIQGTMTVLTNSNATFYKDDTADGGFQVDAQLVGAGSITYYHDSSFVFNPNYVGDLNITGTSNTFSGQWIVGTGPLLGSGAGSLGTNNIIVQSQGALETLYDLNNTNGSLTLDGLMYLHQDDTFKSVVINGAPLGKGTYTFAQLTAAFPTNFPATWVAIDGSTTNTGSGSITALSGGLLIGQVTGTPFSFTITATDSASSIANTNSITVKFNGAAVTPTSVTKSGGVTTITCAAPNPPIPSGATNTISLTIKDTGTPPATVSADRQFVLLYSVLPASWAKPAGSGLNPGFSCRAIQIDSSVTTSLDSVDWMEAILSGQYAPVASGLDNPQVVNYYGAGGPTGNFPASGEDFAAAFSLAGQNNFAMEAVAYLALSPGAYTFGVSSEDGFRVTAGNYASDKSQMLGAEFPVARAPGGTTWQFVVLTGGLYPFRLAYWQGDGAVGECEFYSVDASGGKHLIGDLTDANAIQAYQFSSALPVNPLQITQPPGSGSVQAYEPVTFTVGVASTVATASSMLFEWTSTSGAHLAYGPSYTIASAAPSAAGSYECSVRLLGYQQPVTNATATLAVTARTDPPTVAKVSGSASTATIIIIYSEPMDPVSAATAANYSADGGLSVISAVVDASDPSGMTVMLTTSPQTAATTYNLTINGVKDSSGNLIAANTKAAFTSALDNITMGLKESSGNDWNSGSYWSDGNPASVSAAANPTQGYELLPGARLRTTSGSAAAVFPGAFLQVDGDGALGGGDAEIRFKTKLGGTVYFPNLVMNGGQLDEGNDVTPAIQGKMTVLTNATLYKDDTADGGYRIDAQLAGTGTIYYFHDSSFTFNPGYVGNLNITGTSNTFSGKWIVGTGPLLGSGAGSLGTNDITVWTQGALETLYDVKNTNGSLYLNGLMYLHQNDTFKSVVINGIPLGSGTYTFAELNSAFPGTFPATWLPILGSSVASGSGSITVTTGAALPSPALTITKSGATVTISWPTTSGAGFFLESASSLRAPITWAAVTQPPVVNGAATSVSLPATNGTEFFQMQK